MSTSGSVTRVLTGIKPSGMPHIGNYVGAIRPTVEASRRADTEGFYFLADLHSLFNTQDPLRIQRSTLEIAASWLAAGLDPSKVWFYRQSDIPEITELTWLLTCVAGKGILNRAHAYKAAVDKNLAEGRDEDFGITAGLFMYPVLMAADILIFKAQQVPVGRDQVQHIEMARDFGQRFNHVYGREFFVLPEAVVDDAVATLPGLDGRKMSKSYDNTIPLFAPRDELKKLIASIVTDSRAPGEAKDSEGSALFQLYQAFATPEETAAFARDFADGIGWGEAKQKLFERIDAEISPLREKYDALIARPADIEAILRDNAARLREKYAIPFLAELREAVGLRDVSKIFVAEKKKAEKTALPSFKQYRESDGRFHFKFAAADGTLLLQSAGFASPKDAGAFIAALKKDGSGLDSAQVELRADVAEIHTALQTLRDTGNE